MSKEKEKDAGISADELDEVEAIGRALAERTPAVSTTTSIDKKLVALAELREARPDLVPEKYYIAYDEHLLNGQSRTEVAKRMGLSRGTIYKYFDKIEAALSEWLQDDESVSSVITPEKIAQILKSVKPLQLDPYELLNGTDARYFQHRRIRSEVSIDKLAQSISQVGVLEPPLIFDHLHKYY